jgi:hypothetical protein
MPVDFTKFAAVLRDLSVPGEVRELPESAPTAAAAAAQITSYFSSQVSTTVRITDGTSADVGE